MKRILFIAWNFPPLGGAGVQRSLKFVRYLPERGFHVTVLTGDGASTGRWSPPDPSLQGEIPTGVNVHRVTGALRGNERLRALIDLGHEIIRTEAPDLIFVSMSPFGDAHVARELSSRSGIPWVADLRDPWALDEFQVYRTGLHRMRQRQRMAQTLSSASLIIMNTPEAAKQCRARFRSLREIPVRCVTNGYDASDFQGFERAHSERFTIVHAGALHTGAGYRQQRRALEYRLLGRIERGVEILPRSHVFLIAALERWLCEEPSIEGRVMLKFIGELTPEDQKVISTSKIERFTKVLGYVPHRESVGHLQSADLLFLPMHKMPAGRRATIVPGKTYEYMASGTPILAALPQGDARDFVQEAGTGRVCEPDDLNSMVAILRSEYQKWVENVPPLPVNQRNVARFERRETAQQLAAALKELPILDRRSELIQ